MLIEIDPTDPESWLIGRVADIIAGGGVAVIPTDTVYGLACDITRADAIERIYALKELDPKKPLAILVKDMATIGHYARGVSNTAFRVMKRVLPGPYTFILPATAEVPKIMLRKRKTIGIRMPANAITLALMAELANPLLTTSIRSADDAFLNDPVAIEEAYERKVDVVVDGGLLLPQPSTVVDLSGPVPELIRAGKGDVDALGMFEEE